MDAGARRAAAFAASFAVSALACWLFFQFAASDGLDPMDFVRGGLIAITSFGLGWGASLSLMGLVYRQPPVPRLAPDRALEGRTVILVPVYNEDPVATFSRVAAMDRSLQPLRGAARFDFAILSDTRSEAIARDEEGWFARLLSETDGEGRIFYRRRLDNRGRKAGNIEDFITQSGGAYDYALILDADSLMEGRTILEMTRRMEAEPRLGLLQTLPRIINARSLFGRAMQFSAGYFSPTFARGVAALQGGEGPFWGHNAMVRVRAFAASCGLPELSGRPPFGGHILSHDYVEAALLARAGWIVRLDTDLVGSYEEGPENLIEHAKRDRRWAQGNLQHARLLAAPGLKAWSRYTFLQGIMAYVTSPLWLAFMIASILAPYFAPAPNYFPEPDQLFPVFPVLETDKAIMLIAGVFALLVLPKLLIVLRGAIDSSNTAAGGTPRALLSVLAEILFSSAIAPLLLMYQTRAVAQIVLGADGGWPATSRSDGRLTWSEAVSASFWIVGTGIAGLVASSVFSPALFVWLIPVLVPMVLAPVVLVVSSRAGVVSPRLWQVELEQSPTAVMLLRREVLQRWTGAGHEPASSASIAGFEAAARHA